MGWVFCFVLFFWLFCTGCSIYGSFCSCLTSIFTFTVMLLTIYPYNVHPNGNLELAIKLMSLWAAYCSVYIFDYCQKLNHLSIYCVYIYSHLIQCSAGSDIKLSYVELYTYMVGLFLIEYTRFWSYCRPVTGLIIVRSLQQKAPGAPNEYSDRSMIFSSQCLIIASQIYSIASSS